MPMANNEKIKLYIVVALACVALIVAYFRFFNQKNGPSAIITKPSEKGMTIKIEPHKKSDQWSSKQPAEKIVTYKIEPYKKTIQRIPKQPAANRQSVLVTDIRDIFKPPPIPPEPERQVDAGNRGLAASKEAAPKEIPLELGGTIIGGKTPMAIINEKFVRLGEKIDIYRVVRIDPNEVVLKAGSHQRILKVLKPEEHLGQ